MAQRHTQKDPPCLVVDSRPRDITRIRFSVYANRAYVASTVETCPWNNWIDPSPFRSIPRLLCFTFGSTRIVSGNSNLALAYGLPRFIKCVQSDNSDSFTLSVSPEQFYCQSCRNPYHDTIFSPGLPYRDTTHTVLRDRRGTKGPDAQCRCIPGRAA